MFGKREILKVVSSNQGLITFPPRTNRSRVCLGLVQDHILPSIWSGPEYDYYIHTSSNESQQGGRGNKSGADFTGQFVCWSVCPLSQTMTWINWPCAREKQAFTNKWSLRLLISAYKMGTRQCPRVALQCVYIHPLSAGLHLFWLMSCLHRVEAQASLGGGGPEGLVCPVELDVAGPEAKMEWVPASTLGYVLSVGWLLDIFGKYCTICKSSFCFLSSSRHGRCILNSISVNDRITCYC